MNRFEGAKVIEKLSENCDRAGILDFIEVVIEVNGRFFLVKGSYDYDDFGGISKVWVIETIRKTDEWEKIGRYLKLTDEEEDYLSEVLGLGSYGCKERDGHEY